MIPLIATIRPWCQRHFPWLLSLALLLLVAGGYLTLHRTNSTSVTELEQTHINPVATDDGPTQPLPLSVELNPEKVALGKRLFHDVRLSGNDTIGCFSCHDLSQGGADGRPRAIGIQGKLSDVNAPTVFNSGFNFSQFWDGRAATLEDQIDGPIQNPKEMASNWLQVIDKLQHDDDYRARFNKLYRTGISAETIKDAIATFERSLITPNSRFDRFLRGDRQALTAQEQHGYTLFQSYGCISCHQGINLGGNMYEKMGLIGDYFADRGNLTEADNGRFNSTRNPEHLHEFKVPSLRNVAKTAPYFHDAHAETLQQAVSIMARYQLGRVLNHDEIEAITAFLTTLTGEYQGKPL